MTIKIIDIYSPHLSAIKQLGRANAQTLGFLPSGGFDDYAAKKQIFGSFDENENCIGYLIYRVARRRATIVHLCVKSELRKNGVARQLVDQLKEATRELLGIGLYCRRDYKIDCVWSSFGFVARGEKDGRGKEKEKLIYWWYDQGHSDLFSQTVQESENKLYAVIDANIFFDLGDPQSRCYEESASLRADWLANALELCIVDEIYTEISRQGDAAKRIYSRERAAQFNQLSFDTHLYQSALNHLETIYPKPKHERTPQDNSDLRQLAKAISAGATHFVTRDNFLLNISESVDNVFGLRILRPVELITRIDEFQRENQYQPARLSGTDIEITLVRGGEEDNLTSIFQSFALGENRAEFVRQLRHFLANPQAYSSHVITNHLKGSLALVIYNKTDPNKLSIPLLRVKKSDFANTLGRHLALKVVLDAAQENRILTQVTDDSLSPDIILALQEQGFISTPLGYRKTHLSATFSAQSLADHLVSTTFETNEETSFFAQIAQLLRGELLSIDRQIFCDIEKILHPVKVSDAPLPCFVIPIQPQWASELFDQTFAGQSLFAPRSELALRNEQVYYRRLKNDGGLNSPGRILWYVSEGKTKKHYPLSKAIRACSIIDEVIIDKPKQLFAKFKRLGIYQWENVYALAKNNVENQIMALRFSSTELFDNPVGFSDLREICKNQNCRINVISPYQVSPEVFTAIYNKGFGR